MFRFQLAGGSCLCLFFSFAWLGGLAAQDLTGHDHHGTRSNENATKAPKLFLGKSPKVIEYQLKRLTNAELLAAERNAEHAKYVPVFAAILVRPGIPAAE